MASHFLVTRVLQRPRGRPPAPGRTIKDLWVRSVLLVRQQSVAVVCCMVAIGVLAPGYSYSLGFALSLLVILGALPRVRVDLLNVALVGLLAINAVSLTWSVSPSRGLDLLLFQVIATTHIVAIRVACVDFRALGKLSVAFLASCLMAVLALVVNASSHGLVNLVSPTERFTVGGLNQNYVGYTLATGFFVLVVLGIVIGPRPRPTSSARLSRRVRLGVTCVLGVLLVYGINLVGTRGALASALLVSSWLVAVRWLGARRVARPLLLGTGIVAFVVTSGFFDRVLARLDVGSRGGADGGLSGRLELWPAARRSISEAPFLGTGAGTFEITNPYRVGAHNAILEVWTGLGLLGLSCFALVLWGAVGLRRSDARATLVTRGALVCVLAPTLLSGYWTLSIVFWMSLALAAQCTPSVAASGGHEHEHRRCHSAAERPVGDPATSKTWSGQASELGAYLPLLRRSWIVLAVGGLVGGVAAWGIGAPPTSVYTSEGQIFVSSSTVDRQDRAAARASAPERMASYVDLLTGPLAAKRIVFDQRLPLAPSDLQRRITASFDASYTTIYLDVRGRSPQESQSLARSVTTVSREIVEQYETPNIGAESLRLVRVVATPDLPPRVTFSPLVFVAVGACAGLGLAAATVMVLGRRRGQA